MSIPTLGREGSAAPVVEGRALVKSFGRTPALTGASVTVAPGSAPWLLSTILPRTVARNSCAKAVADAPRRVTVKPVVSETPERTVFLNALPEP